MVQALKPGEALMFAAWAEFGSGMSRDVDVIACVMSRMMGDWIITDSNTLVKRGVCLRVVVLASARRKELN